MQTRYKVMPAVAIATLLGVLGVREGYKHYPYRDSVGVLTVCSGITGPDVVEGKYYSDAECNTLQTNYAKTMAARMGNCLTVDLSEKEWLAYAHWSWNIGTYAFCHSKAVSYLNQGQRLKACDAMLNFHYAGGKDCYVKANNCYGIITRRQYERAMCISGI